VRAGDLGSDPAGSTGAFAAERLRHKSRLRAALLLTTGVFAVEVAGGLASHSLALLADAAHLFMDLAALTLAYAAVTLGERAPTGRHTFGFGRAEVLAAFVNAQLLVVAAVAVLVESWRRFRMPGPIQTDLMLATAVVGLAANVAAIRILRGVRRGSLNIRAAYLEVLTDAGASLAVIGGAVVMTRTGWYGLDALLSAGIALLILPRGVGILREAAHILLEGAPEEVDVPRVRSRIQALPGVEAVHDLHFWTLTSGQYSASVHITVKAATGRGEVLAAVQEVLRESAGVDHATIQVEQQGEEVACVSTASHA
jgi:cobalt-zinc-cadmium efflux system protein